MIKAPFLVTTFLAATLLAATTSAFAQPTLPDRPIARTEAIAGLKKQFIAMDDNHDGTISRDEFDAYRAQQATGHGEDAGLFSHVGAHWFDRADANGDGRVTLTEAEVRPLQMFDMADANHDGVVSLEESKIAMMMMSLGGK